MPDACQNHLADECQYCHKNTFCFRCDICDTCGPDPSTRAIRRKIGGKSTRTDHHRALKHRREADTARWVNSGRGR